MKNRVYTGVIVALLVANLLVLVQDTLARRSSAFDQINVLLDLRHEIVQQYVEEPDQGQMVDAAIEGMISSLNDPYTSYLSPEDLEGFDKRIRGTFSGIGAEVTVDKKEQRLKIVSPLEEMPAWQAGVMAGDIVLEIDGVDTKGMDINEAVDRLTGEEGTDVTIRVRHESGKEETISITRARITVPTVKGLLRDHETHWRYVIMPEPGIAYVRVTQFTGTTAEDLRQVIRELDEEGVRGLILDVRFNPGGLLDSAVDVADMFLEGDKVIVSTRGRAVPESERRSTGDHMLSDVPIVVLANEASASASEIVTGALKDHGRAQFIGTRTFGKGSVQQIKMLESGQGAIKLTNAYYYLPSGRNIHRRPDEDIWGVDHDNGFYVPMSTEEIERMQKIRREGDIVRAGDPDKPLPEVDAEFVREQLGDPQLAKAIEALVGRLADGTWPEVGLGNVQERVEATQKRNALMSEKMYYQRRLEEVQEQLKALDEPAASEPVAVRDEDDAAAAEVKTPAAGQTSPEAATAEP